MDDLRAQNTAPTVLATDLDGTFLGGSLAARQRLSHHFADGAQRKLIYVTGRDMPKVQALIADGTLPVPDKIICDVGTTVAAGDGALDTSDVGQNIATAWQAVKAPITTALAQIDGLRLQDVFGPNRVSYYYDTEAARDAGAAKIAELGGDPIASDGHFLDALPAGVNKGSTLLAAAESWGIDPATILVAGDTLNDLAMLNAGFKAVAVGNSEPPLLEALPTDAPHIYRARAHGCDGIIEALSHFGVEVA